MSSRESGFEKEREAAAYLKKNGYKILATNYVTPFGEIDIIAEDKNEIVFVEVKYRKSSYSGLAQEAVNALKQKKIIKSALLYIKRNCIKKNIRFDVAAVSDAKIELIKSAFTPAESQYYF
ncbi:MAG: YraN family protein [Endomicrobium sp.]|jgi:putative endonuclease|nr:YraN family protein [Endomicrobium sp.]